MSKSVIWLYCILFCFNISTIYAQTIPIEEAFTETFERPVGIEYSHEGSNMLYIVRKEGFVDVKNLDDPDAPSTNFIDISDRVSGHFGELGLLGMAFSPSYPDDETFYLYYTFRESGGERDYYSTLARFKAPGGVADPDSEERLFEILQPQDNHNGGKITFGPDGYLYVAVGDGGRDSRELAQNTKVLNGSILRIDVSPETGYEIPSDNPFVGNPDGLDEIYAWGLRNPWRISFDPETGNLWAADVGEKDREAIYLIDKGKNYGWPIIEGSVCVPVDSECDKTELELPVFEYEYSDRIGKSITGGYVYRGDKNPSLYGKYIYGDFITRKIWALEVNHDNRKVISNSEIATSDQNLPTFGVDSSGEIYVGGWSDEDNSKIFRLEPEVVLSTLTLNMNSIKEEQSVRLSWDVERDSGIELFNVYRGPDPDNLSLYTTVLSDKNEFIETDIPDGISFYAVSAVDMEGVESDLSNTVSYVNSSVEISENWSLISLPFETDGITLLNSVAYSFDGSYEAVDQIMHETGYWARSYESEIYQAKGVGIQDVILSLNEGWNLVGGLAGNLPVEFIDDVDGILNSTPVFELKNSVYSETTTISPYNGYWIHATESGEISFNLENIDASQTSPKPFAASISQEPEKLDKLLFSSDGYSVDFNISHNTLESELMNHFRIPPVAPNASLDVRTPDGFSISDKDRFEIDLTASSYPVRVQFDKGLTTAGRVNTGYSYQLVLEVNGNREEILLNNGDTALLQEEYDSIFLDRVQSESSDEIVHETELLPSYPNPFNPMTNITYRLSEQQQVSLSVFDAAGRRIAILVDNEQEAGRYTLPFDASGLASGIYFVRFSAGEVLSTQKLTLIK